MHNDWQLAPTTGQAAIPLEWHFGTGLPQGSFNKAQLLPAVKFKDHTGKTSL